MLYNDLIYGKTEITEPVILALLESFAMQRLKGVDQAGYFEPFFPGTRLSRFEHSVGVYLLLRQFGAEISEQIAGLIHDVSHSVFSHCADYVFSEGSQKEQNHQDNIFDYFVRKTEIPIILMKYGFNLEYILEDKNFPLKENNLPDICADRIDYSLRTIWCYRKYAPEQAKKIKTILADLDAKDGEWIFTNYQSAQAFANLFFYANKYFYSNIESAVMFRTTGDYLKYALNKKYILEKDLYSTDTEVLQKINAHMKDDLMLQNFWARMNNKISYTNNPDNYDAQVFCKSRVIDPVCYNNGRITHISEINPIWKEVVREEMQPKKYFLKFN